MPRKAFRNKRRFYNRRRRYKNKTMLGRPNNRMKLKPSIYFFKRSVSEVITLRTDSPPSGWGVVDGAKLYKQFYYTLNMVSDYSDFTNLFKFYKICGVKQELIFSNSASVDSNQRIMIYMDKWNGRTEVLNENLYLHSQTAKRRIVPSNSVKPVGFYVPLRIANDTLAVTGTNYTWSRPRWIATDVVDLLHYGMNIMVGRTDDNTFGSTGVGQFPSIKIITTLYIACKKVG